MTTRFTDHVLTGDHASRPAASAVPQGTLYSCTDHDLIYKSDGSSAWSTWATVGGSGGGDANPGWIDDLVGTSDADEFYWDGDDLSSSFTAQTVSGTATWTEADNLASVVVNNQTSDDVAAQLTAVSFSIGDEWVLPLFNAFLPDGSSGNLFAGIMFADGTGTGANCVAGHIQLGATSTTVVADEGLPILVGRHGTLTDISTAPWVGDRGILWRPNILYIKLIYQASNTFRLQFSPDGVSWSAFGESDISKTMTPTHVGPWAARSEAVDAICTFGPLRKVA